MSLTATGIAHYYRPGTPVLCGVDIEIERGSKTAIVGPSGSGKTTLLSILGMLIEPLEGHVALNGAPLTGRQGQLVRLRHFGWIFQTSNSLPRRSVLDNVAMPLVLSGVPRNAAITQAREVLASVGLGDRLFEPARLLSGGEIQRLGVARALVVRPEYLFADEPTGNLDASTSRLVADGIWGLCSEMGSSLIIATHDLHLANRCDRVLALEEGHLVDE